MTRDLYPRAKETFFEVVEVPREQRGDLLRRLCASDEELRAEVESLLAQEDGGFLEKAIPEPILAAVLGDPSPGFIGRRLGPFRICAFLGEGGMGRVWMAEQDNPRRSVAVKVMRAAIASDEGVRRFQHEVELLGRLQHPGIAQIYQADTFDLDGQKVPYFAMELVPGACTLDRYVADEEPDLSRRVELFERVCDAVNHGHQRGVIHRDLKPANVLVDGEGSPKVIDFGVARATNSDVTVTSLHTRVGELVGTLRYMSPEQCESDPGGLDSRSDVYSLGVILYELLCGRSPYEITDLSIPAAMTVIRESDPVPPGRIHRRLRGDLEAVVLRAMEKDRARRYGSAAELALDLRRWRSGEPVDARVPGAWRMTARWIGRHPVLSTAVVSALVAASSLGSTYLTIQRLLAPVRIAIDENGQVGVLRSQAGKDLVVWDSGRAGGLVHCELVERPRALGGGQVVVVAFDVQASRTPWAGLVCFFEVDDPHEPYWVSTQAPLVLPEGEPDRREESVFTPACVLAGDLFSARPGVEVAVAHRLNPFSATCIRVYDLSGEVLYETWNDGAISALQRLAVPPCLVACGLDSEKRWDERGLAMEDSAARYPSVLIALDMGSERGVFGKFLAREGRLQDPSVLWYRWLGPAHELAPLQEAGAYFETLTSQLSSKNHFQVVFRTNTKGDGKPLNPPLGLHMIVDSTGREVRRYTDDAWKRWQREGVLPSDRAFRLLDYSELPLPEISRSE